MKKVGESSASYIQFSSASSFLNHCMRCLSFQRMQICTARNLTASSSTWTEKKMSCEKMLITSKDVEGTETTTHNSSDVGISPDTNEQSVQISTMSQSEDIVQHAESGLISTEAPIKETPTADTSEKLECDQSKKNNLPPEVTELSECLNLKRKNLFPLFDFLHPYAINKWNLLARVEQKLSIQHYSSKKA